MRTKLRPSLTCCDAARITRAVTLEAEGQGQPDFAERCRLDPPVWRLRLAPIRDETPLYRLDQETADLTLAYFDARRTPVLCCPFCGAKAPALRLAADPPAKLCISTDGGYSCGTCGEDRDCECAPPESLWEPATEPEGRARTPPGLTRDEALALRAVFDGMGGPVELDDKETAAFNAAADKIAAWCDGPPDRPSP